jgi:hypothetical protein
MAQNERPDQEPEASSQPPPQPPSKGRQSFSKLRRELSDEELSSPAVQRLLIDEIERLERDSSELKGFRDRYYEADRKSAVLEVENKISKAHEVMYGVCLTMGAASLGFAPNLWSHQPAGYISIAFGIVLIGGGVASRMVRK